MRRRVVAAAVLFGALVPAVLSSAPKASATASGLPAGFQDNLVIGELDVPTAVRFSPDGRVFVAEKRGTIKVFTGLSDPAPRVFADLRTQVYNYSDRGLLGLTLAPNFPTDPHLYIAYTANADIGGTAPKWPPSDVSTDSCPNPPGATTDGCVVSARVSRLTVGNDGLMSGAEQVLVNDWCQQFPSHSIGTVAFGPDGYLYAGAGDGASFDTVDYGQFGSPKKNPCGDPPTGVGTNLTAPTSEGGALRSQDMQTTGDPTGLDGSIIRIDSATGAPAPGNPTTTGDTNARRIVSYGYRNPFRFAFRPGTSELWVGDVGWNTTEEINRIASPTAAPVANFGWPCYEGAEQQPGYSATGFNLCTQLYNAGTAKPPFFSYTHQTKIDPNETCPMSTAAISGLAFYQGGSYPTAYGGTLFFADYARQCIWSIRAGSDGVPDPTTVKVFDDGASFPVDLEIGPGGDLFYVDIVTGAIHRISYPTGVQPPRADIVASPSVGSAPLDVHLDGSGSTDPSPNEALSYAWDLDHDGAYDDAAGQVINHTFPYGDHTVGLQVTDTDGRQGTTSVTIHSGTTPVPVIDTPSAGSTWKVGDTISFTGHAADQANTPLPAEGLSWDVVLYHCPGNVCHTHPVQSFTGVAGGSIDGPNHDYPSHLQLRLTATDSFGHTATVARDLYPETIDLSVQSRPAGIAVAFDGTQRLAPYAVTVIKGSTHSLAAPASQVVGSDRYSFGGWSDAGGRAHSLVTSTPTSYVASYGVVAKGYLLDGFGGLHAVNGAAPATGGATFSFDIARAVALAPDGQSGYVLDGFGGLHGFNAAPPVAGTPYFAGRDLARDLVLTGAGQGYVLDAYGGIHRFGGAPDLGAGPYFPGFDIARRLALVPGHPRWAYVLDGYGGVHAIGGAPALPGPYFAGHDVARGLTLRSTGGGYLLDAFGGVHALGSAPPVSTDPGTYTAGVPSAAALVLTDPAALGESGGYVASGFGAVTRFGTPFAIARPATFGYDITRGLALSIR
jgi:glucose/arabinose dehydrogenase